MTVWRDMTVVLDQGNRLGPDVVVLRKGAVADPDQTAFHAKDVILAIEAVSPDLRFRDRDTQPHKYAQAGIQHFWRVENHGGRPVVHAFELEPTTTRQYATTGIFHDELKVSAPFPITLDLTEITRDIEDAEEE